MVVYMTVPACADEIGVTRKAIYNFITHGTITPVRLNHKINGKHGVLVNPDEVMQAANANSNHCFKSWIAKNKSEKTADNDCKHENMNNTLNINTDGSDDNANIDDNIPAVIMSSKECDYWIGLKPGFTSKLIATGIVPKEQSNGSHACMINSTLVYRIVKQYCKHDSNIIMDVKAFNDYPDMARHARARIREVNNDFILNKLQARTNSCTLKFDYSNELQEAQNRVEQLETTLEAVKSLISELDSDVVSQIMSTTAIK